MENINERELNEDDLENIFGGLSKEQLAERYGITVERINELIQSGAITMEQMRSVATGMNPNYAVYDNKITAEEARSRRR